jgi:hypothetical protein
LKIVLNEFGVEHEGEIPREIAQLKESERVLSLLAQKQKPNLKDLYKAISLTKNALHSARRKALELLSAE